VAHDDAVAADGPPDVVLASGMFDLPAWLGLTRRILGDPPVVLYLHENQLGYPLSPNQRADDEFPLANWRSMVAADEVWCNSRFQLDELLGGLPALLDRSPDESHAHLLGEVSGRCSVVPVGVELVDVPDPGDRDDSADELPLVLWNHRWDHDKNPAAVFRALARLADEGLGFEVAIAGENVRVDPREMVEARSALGDRVVQFGHLPRSDYVALLGRAVARFAQQALKCQVSQAKIRILVAGAILFVACDQCVETAAGGHHPFFERQPGLLLPMPAHDGLVLWR
jgi:glycosyltransferase involved in cell wall biosynthesis